MKKGDEIIVLKITRKAFEVLYNAGLIDLKSEDYELKEVEIHQEEFKNNDRWVKLKEASTKAFKDLKEYEFNLRNGK